MPHVTFEAVGEGNPEKTRNERAWPQSFEEGCSRGGEQAIRTVKSHHKDVDGLHGRNARDGGG